MASNVKITSAQYANSENTLVFVLLESGETWFVVPNNGSGQANILQAWVAAGGNIGPYVPVVPGGVVPAGAIIWYAAQRVPSGYLMCDGSAVRRAQYATLFRAIGTTFGAGDGATTFNLPDLVGRFVRGWGPVNPLDPGRAFGSLQLDMVGSHRHGLDDPGHTHQIVDPGHAHDIDDPGHTHTFTDPGHNHPVNDPGHSHPELFYSQGYAAAYNGAGEVLKVDADRSAGIITLSTQTAQTKVTIATASANVVVEPAQANLNDISAVTGVSLVPSGTNINYTEYDGGEETRPINVAMMPLIRY